MINAQISRAESSVSDFWKMWNTRSSNVSVTQVPAEVWFEHFSKLLYNERAPPSLPELDERGVSGLTDEISIDEGHCGDTSLQVRECSRSGRDRH